MRDRVTLEETVTAALDQLEARSERMNLNDFGRWVGRSCSLAIDRGEFDGPMPGADDFTSLVCEIVFRLDPKSERVGPPLAIMRPKEGCAD